MSDDTKKPDDIIRKALRYPVAAGCYLGWGGTYGKFPPLFGHE